MCFLRGGKSGVRANGGRWPGTACGHALAHWSSLGVNWEVNDTQTHRRKMATLDEKLHGWLLVGCGFVLAARLILKKHTPRRTKSDCCIWNEAVFAVIVFSNPWDFRETLHRCAPDWWVYFTPGYMVQATDWSAASVPTLLSEEVTSIHPIKLLAQARQLWKIGAIPAFLSQMGPLLNWEGWTCFWGLNVKGRSFFHAIYT